MNYLPKLDHFGWALMGSAIGVGIQKFADFPWIPIVTIWALGALLYIIDEINKDKNRTV